MTHDTDLSVYLTAARSLMDGSDLYATPAANGLYYVYLPLIGVLFIPLQFLPVLFVKAAWTLASIVLIGWSVHMCSHALPGMRREQSTYLDRYLLYAIPVILGLDAISTEIGDGQVNSIVLAASVLACTVLYRRQASSGLVLGLSAIAKVFSGPLILHSAIGGRWKAVLGATTGIIMGLLLPAGIIGWELNEEYISRWTSMMVLHPDLTTHPMGNYGNASLQAVFTRLFSNAPAFIFEGATHFITIAQLPSAIASYTGAIVFLVCVAVLALYVKRFRHAEVLISEGGAIALSFCLAPLMTPIAERHHYLFLIPCYSYLTYVWLNRVFDRRLFYFCAGAAVVCTLLTIRVFFGIYVVALSWALGAPSFTAVFTAAAVFVAAEKVANSVSGARGPVCTTES
jgi:hypothetical protein